MEVFFSCRMGARDTPGARSRALGRRFGRRGPAAAPSLLFLPPQPVFCPKQPLCPGFAQILEMLLHHTRRTNLHPAPVTAFGHQRCPHETESSACPQRGVCSARGWRCVKPETSPSFCNSHVIPFKRPLSSASTWLPSFIFVSQFGKFVKPVTGTEEASPKSNQKHVINNN